jgi:DNA-binding MarR family transcriptional regulator
MPSQRFLRGGAAGSDGTRTSWFVFTPENVSHETFLHKVVSNDTFLVVTTPLRTAWATDGPGDESPFALGLLLRRAHDRVAAELLGVLRPLGLEFRHFIVLVALHTGGPMSQRALAGAVGSDKATMVRVVDDLEHAGLVTRDPRPGDRRVHTITPTPAGTAVFGAAHQHAEPVAAHLLEGLGDIRPLLTLLTRLAFPGDA